jgi:uncharacterized coiled-coil protein SlyX
MTPTERYEQCRRQLSLAKLKIHELENEVSAQEKALSHYTEAVQDYREQIDKYERLFAEKGLSERGFSLQQEMLALLEEGERNPK